MDDLQAVRRLKQGDIGGLEGLIARHQAKALRAAFLITQDESSAQDIVADAFIRFFERADRFDEGRPFEPYFLRSVVHAALNTLRRAKKQAPLKEWTEPAPLDYLLTQAAGVEDQVEYRRIKREIQAAIRALPPRQRAAVVLRYYLDMSEREMAAELQAAPGTVKWLLNAARTRLRDLFGAERSRE
jgi:RNA polymerase sigma-70 factor (ECF subfamily)